MKLLKLLIAFLIFASASFAQAAHSNKLTWSWSQGTGDPATGFHVWRSSGTGGTCAAMGSTPYATVTSPTIFTYTDTAVAGGQSWCYQVTAYASTTDSSPSNEVTCLTPFLLTTPTGLSGVAQ